MRPLERPAPVGPPTSPAPHDAARAGLRRTSRPRGLRGLALAAALTGCGPEVGPWPDRHDDEVQAAASAAAVDRARGTRHHRLDAPWSAADGVRPDPAETAQVVTHTTGDGRLVRRMTCDLLVAPRPHWTVGGVPFTRVDLSADVATGHLVRAHYVAPAIPLQDCRRLADGLAASLGPPHDVDRTAPDHGWSETARADTWTWEGTGHRLTWHFEQQGPRWGEGHTHQRCSLTWLSHGPVEPPEVLVDPGTRCDRALQGGSPAGR